MSENKSSANRIEFKKIATYGINMFFKYLSNIRENRKIYKSWVCIIFILLGGIAGMIITLFVSNIRESVALLLQYNQSNWLTNIITFIVLIVVGTSIGSIVGNLLCKLYYYNKYGCTNIQYVPLSSLKNYTLNIDKFSFKYRNTIIKLTEQQIFNIDENIIKFILAKKTIDRKILKTAHERFRAGNVVESMLSNPFIIYLIDNELGEKGHAISEFYTPLSILSNNNISPENGNLITRINVMLEIVNKLSIDIIEVKHLIELSEIPKLF
jgi:hypothetical protein